MPRTHHRCCVPTCNLKIEGLSYHEFPANLDVKDDWLKNIFSALGPGTELKLFDTSGICSLHFEETCFKNTVSGRRILTRDAIPTIFNSNKILYKVRRQHRLVFMVGDYTGFATK